MYSPRRIEGRCPISPVDDADRICVDLGTQSSGVSGQLWRKTVSPRRHGGQRGNRAKQQRGDGLRGGTQMRICMCALLRVSRDDGQIAALGLYHQQAVKGVVVMEGQPLLAPDLAS